jgi:hypothetical protein
MSGYTYELKENPERRHAGVIAQEIIELFPEVVHGDQDTAYSVAYGNMAGIFIEAIKELEERVTTLEKLLDADENIGDFRIDVNKIPHIKYVLTASIFANVNPALKV